MKKSFMVCKQISRLIQIVAHLENKLVPNNHAFPPVCL